MFNSIIKLFVLSLYMLCLTSCSITRSTYIPEVKLHTAPKEINCVDYLSQKPKRAAIRIGSLNVNGNEFSNDENLIKEAKKQAAKIGGDFILIENAGIESQTVYSPGYSKYQSSSDANINQCYGYKNEQASGCSVGPSFNTRHFPWGNFSVWIYVPAQTGIRFDHSLVVNGFHLNCDAESCGVRIGDKLLGINGYDIQEEKLVHHIMYIQPRDQVTVNLQRDGKRIDCVVTAIEN